ncbi:MAG: hypothetical protein CMQ41_04800 [Gammaproteobacteria bacterium]|nr:hypothetical protein [Gammaproteobacteria bacterium]
MFFVLSAEQWFASLAIELSNASGYTELRTMYIGLMGSVGVFSIVCACNRQLHFAGVLFALLSYTGLALVRSWGIFVANEYNQLMLQLWFAEVLSILAASFSLYCLRRPQ